MKRLSLAELKAKANVVANVEAIKGGEMAECHNGSCAPPPKPSSPESYQEVPGSGRTN